MSISIFLSRKTFATGAVSDSVGIGDFESPFLKIIAVVKFRTAHKESAFWIDDDAYILRFYDDISWKRAFNEIHFVL
jgi:hypothetical protein